MQVFMRSKCSACHGLDEEPCDDCEGSRVDAVAVVACRWDEADVLSFGGMACALRGMDWAGAGGAVKWKEML